jgi:Bacterial Ig domain/Calx-beta domain
MSTSAYRLGVAAAVLAALCGTASGQMPPVVTISAQTYPARTLEPCPVCFAPAMGFTVTRTGDTSHALAVHLQTGGTATVGVDYVPLATPFEIPAGKSSASFFLTALDDLAAEGPEIVEIILRQDTALYNAGSPLSVMGVIYDDESGAPSERLDITEPAGGTVFGSGVASIRLEALAVSTTREIDVPVEFFANGVKIGQSAPVGFGRPPIPGLPREHEFTWNAPPDGSHVVTARTPATPGPWLEARPIQIHVGPQPQRPLVSIVATSRVAEEDSAPTMRPLRLRGEFTITRTGGTSNPQPVYLHVSGTAARGTDYTALPMIVTIPAGSASAKVPVDAIPDNLAEPLESVIAEVSTCPPGNILPFCYDFDIDAAQAHDTVLIRDDGISTASLEIIAPHHNEVFGATQSVTINVTALDLHGGITRVDFYAGDAKIGTSELFFFAPPPPAEPVYHTFAWQTPPLGRHVLIARAVSSSGTAVASPPVTIFPGSDIFLPSVRVSSPADGSQIPSGTPVEITVQATDPDGHTHAAEFYANGHKLGEVVLNFLVPPPPGETQSFDFTWQNAPPGSYVLSARARDDDGNWGTSPPVAITIIPADTLPIITAHALDPFAVEPDDTHPVNTATFRLRRHGSTTTALSVNFTMHGTATSGADYATLNGLATFPASASDVDILLTPLVDNFTEYRETAVLQVEAQFDDGPQRYHVGARRHSIAVIGDRLWAQQNSVHEVCSPLGEGHFHLWFPVGPAAPPMFRIEATDNFQQWETVQEAAAVDNALHFVDPDTPGLPRRFYRLTPDFTAAGP